MEDVCATSADAEDVKARPLQECWENDDKYLFIEGLCHSVPVMMQPRGVVFNSGFCTPGFEEGLYFRCDCAGNCPLLPTLQDVIMASQWLVLPCRVWHPFTLSLTPVNSSTRFASNSLQKHTYKLLVLAPLTIFPEQ